MNNFKYEELYTRYKDLLEENKKIILKNKP
jgi:hypothetical protein